MHAAAAEIYKRPDAAYSTDETPEARVAGSSTSRLTNKFPRDENAVQGLGIAPRVLETIAPVVEYVADTM
jgi:hypothetical protein